MLRDVWPEWYGPGGPGDAEADLRLRARLAGLPWGVVALEGGRPVGTAALGPASHGAEAGEGPWLLGLVAAPAWRGRGIGSALVAACEAEARRGGHGRLLATTEAAEGLLRRRGWDEVRRLPDGCRVLAVSL